MNLWTETLPLIAWGIIILGFCYVFWMNYQTSRIDSTAFQIRKYPKEAFEKVDWFWGLKRKQLKDLSYTSIGGFKQTRGDGHVMKKCVQKSYHDKYGRIYKIEEYTTKYDKDGEPAETRGGGRPIEIHPLYMYNHKNLFESYLKSKKAEAVFIKDGIPQI